MTVAAQIATAALALIENPARFTTGADARDAKGENAFGGTDEAVAWSCLGAVNRIAVLEHTRELEGWRTLFLALRKRGVDHNTPHVEAVAVLRELANAR